MTHIEDNTPAGTPWTVQYRSSYLNNRRALIDMAHPDFREQLERAARERRLL